MFRRLAVFTGSFDRQCAIDVIGRDLEPDLARDALTHLLDVSLVAPVGGPSVRLRLLETVRSYAGRLLAESGERLVIARSHAVWFTEWAELGADRFENAQQTKWLDTLDVEFTKSAPRWPGASALTAT